MSRNSAQKAVDPAIARLLATLATIPASQAPRLGKLHAWIGAERVFFVWDGRRYQARPEAS